MGLARVGESPQGRHRAASRSGAGALPPVPALRMGWESLVPSVRRDIHPRGCFFADGGREGTSRARMQRGVDVLWANSGWGAGHPAQGALAPQDLGEPCERDIPPKSQLPGGWKGPAVGADTQLCGVLSLPGLPAWIVRPARASRSARGPPPLPSHYFLLTSVTEPREMPARAPPAARGPAPVPVTLGWVWGDRT